MLSLSNLRKAYSDRVAVVDVSLDIRPGEIVGLLGPNGAGKSTTLHMAAGLLRPDKGSVTLYDGTSHGPPHFAPHRAALGYAPQALALYEELTARENLALFAGLAGLDRRAVRERVNQTLRAVGLHDRADDRAATFSGGMKRRLNLGMAVVHQPPVVLLDEPTVGVDPQSRNAIFELISGLKSQGCAILYTTHYMEEAQRLCDHLAIIDQGRILARGSVQHLIATFGGDSTVILERQDGEHRIQTDDPLRAIASAIVAGGIEGMRIERPSLESVFLRLTGRNLRD